MPSFLQTTDNIRIAYNYYPVDKPVGYLLLVHMMPATKESWVNFATLAQKYNLASIAIDLRGHGQSDGGPDGYRDFSDDDHQKSFLDLVAATEQLKRFGAVDKNIFLVGASIGANLSLRYLAEYHSARAAVLLSAGLNYHGVNAAAFVPKLASGQGIVLVASEDDNRSGGNCATMNQQLAKLVSVNIVKEVMIYRSGGHGTDLLETHQELSEKIINFLKRFT
ncbi:MAG: alpha/beta fold hydrolase [bacterium]|nr:alpha/beta fold hydrolase [bacterium]